MTRQLHNSVDDVNDKNSCTVVDALIYDKGKQKKNLISRDKLSLMAHNSTIKTKLTYSTI